MAKINDEYDIGAAFEAIENELMASMIRNMESHKQEEIDEDKQWSMWQTEMLKSLEEYKHNNQKKYGKQFKDINAKIAELIRTARAEGNMQQEITILNAIKKGFPANKISKGGTAEFFKLNDRKLEALIKATTDDMKKAETAVLRMANDQYRRIIYNAQVYANTGAGTYEKAVDMATKDFLKAGLNCVEYANGARHTLADYADMAIRTAAKRAYLQGEGMKRREWGVYTVIINKRGSGCPCPLCVPFVGKVMIDDVWSGGPKDGVSPVTGIKYPLISAAIASGLYHPRCRDSHTTYIEGVNTPPDGKYTREELNNLAEKNARRERQQYAERQEKKYNRLSQFSLDPEKQQVYGQKQKEWQHVRMKTGNMDSQEYAESKRPLADFHAVPQNQIVSLLRTESQDWIDRLSEKEKHAIEKYTFNSGDQKPARFFERLNAMLRGDIAEDKKLREYAETISGALKKSKIQHDVIAYRNLDIPLYDEFEVNDLVTEGQFISTSVTQGAALNKSYKILIYVPKGSKGAYIERISRYPKQRELLLDKDTIFRVISKKEKEIELQVIV